MKSKRISVSKFIENNTNGGNTSPGSWSLPINFVIKAAVRSSTSNVLSNKRARTGKVFDMLAIRNTISLATALAL
jgi:hypothetical protein